MQLDFGFLRVLKKQGSVLTPRCGREFEAVGSENALSVWDEVPSPQWCLDGDLVVKKLMVCNVVKTELESQSRKVERDSESKTRFCQIEAVDHVLISPSVKWA